MLASRSQLHAGLVGLTINDRQGYANLRTVSAVHPWVIGNCIAESQALRQRFTQAAGGSGYTRIAALNVPTLIIWGGRDQLIPPVSAERFQRNIEDCRVVLFDDLGHVPQEEDPARTVAVLQTFLNE